MNMEKIWGIIQILGTFLGTLIIVYITHLLTLNSQKQISDYQKKQLAYSKLLSLRFPMKQLYISRFEARIFSDFYEARWHNNGSPKESLDLNESIRWMKQSEDIVFKIIENHKELYLCLGDIQILFKETSELNSLISNFYNLKGITVKSPSKEFNNDLLEKWKIKATNELQEIVEKTYDNNIDKLAYYLKNELKK